MQHSSRGDKWQESSVKKLQELQGQGAQGGGSVSETSPY